MCVFIYTYILICVYVFIYVYIIHLIFNDICLYPFLMPQRHSKYQVCWEVEFKILKVGPSENEARCIDCNSVFLVKNGGHSDVIKHVNGKRHKKIQEQNCYI